MSWRYPPQLFSDRFCPVLRFRQIVSMSNSSLLTGKRFVVAHQVEALSRSESPLGASGSFSVRMGYPFGIRIQIPNGAHAWKSLWLQHCSENALMFAAMTLYTAHPLLQRLRSIQPGLCCSGSALCPYIVL